MTSQLNGIDLVTRPVARQASRAGDESVEEELGGLKSYWSSKNLSKDEKFLRDYILNRKYLGNEDEDNEEGAGLAPNSFFSVSYL